MCPNTSASVSAPPPQHGGAYSVFVCLLLCSPTLVGIRCCLAVLRRRALSCLPGGRCRVPMALGDAVPDYSGASRRVLFRIRICVLIRIQVSPPARRVRISLSGRPVASICEGSVDSPFASILVRTRSVRALTALCTRVPRGLRSALFHTCKVSKAPGDPHLGSPSPPGMSR